MTIKFVITDKKLIAYFIGGDDEESGNCGRLILYKKNCF